MKLSVFMPTIRTHLLENWYSSLEYSCNRHDFNVILCGPFDPPNSILSRGNVVFIKDFGSPTRSAQLAALSAAGELLYHVTDDVLFFPNVISNEIDLFETNTITALRYTEGIGYEGDKLPLSYWYAPNAYPNWPGVNQNWGIGVHFLMHRQLFIDFGGFDCRFHYLNHAGHDLLFRMQKSGIKYKTSLEIASKADWMPGVTGDHAAIHNAQIFHDDPLFRHIWFHGREDSIIDKNNWLNQPDVWTTRFKNTNINSYRDLYDVNTHNR
jgi:hypothetical protein